MKSVNEECPKCFGRKVIPINIILSTACPKCNGHGDRDWISHAMNKRERPDMNFMRSVCVENVQHLMQEIKNQCAMIGLVANIEIKTESLDSRYRETWQGMMLPDYKYGG